MIYSIAMVALCQLAPIPDLYNPAAKHVDSRRFVVICDQNRESKIIRSELTRDWTASGKKSPPKLRAWASLQSRVSGMVKIVGREHAGPEFRHVNEGYPYYRLGDRGEVRRFPEEMFFGSGTALLSMDVLIANETMDLAPWKNECYEVNIHAELSHVCDVVRWLKKSLPQELGEDSRFDPRWGEADNIGFLYVESRYSAYDGYPTYAPPELPPAPLRRFPWESGYVFPPEIEPVLIAPPPPEELP